MLGLVFRNPEGIEGYTEAEDFTEANEMIAVYINKGYTLVRIMHESVNAYYVVRRSNDSIYTIIPSKGIDSWFTELAHTIAFSDCSGEEVILIIYEGKEIPYIGWQPNMLYEFTDEAGNIIWSNSFPQWDH